jgi:hypothetical protein
LEASIPRTLISPSWAKYSLWVFFITCVCSGSGAPPAETVAKSTPATDASKENKKSQHNCFFPTLLFTAIGKIFALDVSDLRA